MNEREGRKERGKNKREEGRQGEWKEGREREQERWGRNSQLFERKCFQRKGSL